MWFRRVRQREREVRIVVSVEEERLCGGDGRVIRMFGFLEGEGGAQF